MGTPLGPKCIRYSCMDPLGNTTKQQVECASTSLQLLLHILRKHILTACAREEARSPQCNSCQKGLKLQQGLQPKQEDGEKLKVPSYLSKPEPSTPKEGCI